MAEFAVEISPPHQQTVAKGGKFAFGFGPATKGRLDVFLAAYESSLRSRQRPARPGPSGIGALPQTSAARVRLGVRPPIDPSIDDVFTGDGPADPPDFVPPNPLDPRAFRVEVFNARGRSLGANDGPISIDVRGVRPPLGGGGQAAPVVARNTWRVEITNNTEFEANVVIHVRYHGLRPILSKPFEIDFINERFDALFNSVQPLQLKFENRSLVPNFPELKTTWFVVVADESWRIVHPSLRDLEFNLGRRVLTEVTQTASAGGITVHACVHDGCPAIRMRVIFEAERGVIDLINLVGLWSDDLADIASLITKLPRVDRPTIDIERLALDVFFVLRPGVYDRQATFEVIAQPTVEFNSPTISVVARMIAQAIFEIALPRHFGDRLDAFAKTFATWLLGDPSRELAGGIEQLDIKYVGDAPRPQVVAPSAVPPTSVPISPGNLSKIDHIVVVMMENRSFDNMLGYLSLPKTSTGDNLGRGRADIEGLTGNEFNPLSLQGTRIQRVFPLSRAWVGVLPDAELRTRPTRFVPDPGHSYRDTLMQRGDIDIDLSHWSGLDPTRDPPFGPGSVHLDRNKGFVINFANRIAGHADIAMVRRVAGEVMGYHPSAHVPTYDFFAAEYAVCDHWFASHPGHTWPNRFASLTGQLAAGPDGFPQVDNPDFATFDPLETPTIVDHLLAANISCRYFEHDFCMLRTFARYTFDHTVIAPIDDPARGFFALARSGKLPSVSFVEPDLTGIDVGNDDHPPADVVDGQIFLRRVYDALSTGPAAQWNKTLLLITYDEHGGFFDHVHPQVQKVFDFKNFNPATFNPTNPNKFVPIALDPVSYDPITHYGMRVPAFVISPWVNAASVSKLVFDHTSIIKTIVARFLANNPPDMGWRVALAEDVGPLLSRRGPQAPPVSAPVNPPLASPKVLSRHYGRTPNVGTTDRDFRDFLRGFRDRVRS